MFTSSQPCKRRRDDGDVMEITSTSMGHPNSLPIQKKPTQSIAYPKSLSVADMLKLGKLISKKASTIVDLYSFDLTHMAWAKMPLAVDFRMEDEPFGTGGFRKAYKATSSTPGFSDTTWVIKKYLPSTLDGIAATNQNAESHTRKAVQMHILGKQFASQLKEKVENANAIGFGPAFKYNKIYMGRTDGGEYVTVEEYINGTFVKYINNNGVLCLTDDMVCDKAQCFAHFTFEKSEGRLIVLDIQGAEYNLYDPEIASSQLLNDDGSFQFCTGNLADIAIKNFFSNHQCNFYCNLLKLKLRPL